MEEFDLNIPLYHQLVSLIKKKIVSDTYRAGTKLPSIRELALCYQVTPNTIQRALQILEAEALIYTERTNGKYVTTDETRIRSLREELLRSQIQILFRNLFQCGFSDQEIRAALETEMENHNKNE